jgi:zinc transport system substrate-binding protein
MLSFSEKKSRKPLTKCNQVACYSSMTQKNILMIIGSLGIIALLAVGSIALFTNDSQDQDSSTTITTSILPVYTIAQEIEGDNISVELLAKGNVDAHDYEPSAGDVRAVLESDVFVYIGGIDGWAEDVATQARDEGVTVIELSQFAITTLEHGDDHDHGHDGEDHGDEHSDEEHDHMDKEGHGDEEKHDEHGHDHGDSEFDPHFWLNPLNAQAFAVAISDAIEGSTVDASRFEALDQSYSDALTSCNLDTAVVSHNAFQYLGERYDFKLLSIAGLEPTDEPSPSEVAEIIEEIEEKNVNYVLVEEEIGADFAGTLADEAGVETLLLTPFESGDINTSYFDYMNDNLLSLQTALECSSR